MYTFTITYFYSVCVLVEQFECILIAIAVLWPVGSLLGQGKSHVRGALCACSNITLLYITLHVYKVSLIEHKHFKYTRWQ